MNDILQKVKAAAGADVHQTVVWVVAFVAVATLVGLGKLEPKVLEMMLMAVAGMSIPRKGPGGSANDTDNT